MRTRRQKISENRQAVVVPLNAGENSLDIPDDLIFEILLRLSTKGIARCRCVSKPWATLLDRQDFADQYLERSSSRPQLLFAVENDGKVSFFSAPQNQEDDNSSTITASYQMSFPVNDVKEIYSPISGLVCIRDGRILNGMKTPVSVWVICNPSTGQYFTLPRMKTRKKKSDMRSFFGYDPVEKQFKVLSMTFARRTKYEIKAISTEHQVLTLKTGKLSWRMIECGVPHHPESDSVCIDGVLYYKAYDGGDIIVSFDVRSEKFSVIKVKEPFRYGRYPLVNYNGKLASISSISPTDCFQRGTTGIEMWVLDDIEKEEWSKHVYKLPPTWGNVVEEAWLHCFNVTASNEAVLSSYRQRSPCYVLYYNLERETIRRFEIQGMEEFMKQRVYTFVDHVEDVKRMKGVLGLSL